MFSVAVRHRSLLSIEEELNVTNLYMSRAYGSEAVCAILAEQGQGLPRQATQKGGRKEQYGASFKDREVYGVLWCVVRD